MGLGHTPEEIVNEAEGFHYDAGAALLDGNLNPDDCWMTEGLIDDFLASKWARGDPLLTAIFKHEDGSFRRGLNGLLEPVRKTRWLCINHHRLAEDLKRVPEGNTCVRYRQGRRCNWDEKDLRGGCLACGTAVIQVTYLPDGLAIAVRGTECMFDFHHRPGTVKEGELSTMVGEYLFRVTGETLQDMLDRLWGEHDKCDLLCACCHRFITAFQMGWGIIQNNPNPPHWPVVEGFDYENPYQHSIGNGGPVPLGEYWVRQP